MQQETQEKNITLIGEHNQAFTIRTTWKVLDKGEVHTVNRVTDIHGRALKWDVQTSNGRILKATTKKSQHLVDMVQREIRKAPVEVVR